MLLTLTPTTYGISWNQTNIKACLARFAWSRLLSRIWRITIFGETGIVLPEWKASPRKPGLRITFSISLFFLPVFLLVNLSRQIITYLWNLVTALILCFYTYLGVPYYAYLKKDEFTSARYGTKPQVLIPTGAQGTIPNLRTASALQKFIDIVSVAGQRYWDKVKALFDETPEGMKNERAVFLARYMSYIKVGEVITTASTTQANTGDYAGRGMLVDGRYLFKRHFTEHGWLFCISSIVPEMAYCGYDRQMTDINILDTPVPTFANIGDQSVINREIRVMYTSWNSNNGSFGDQFRYYAYKADVNRIHGDFLMQSFAPWTATLPLRL